MKHIHLFLLFGIITAPLTAQEGSTLLSGTLTLQSDLNSKLYNHTVLDCGLFSGFYTETRNSSGSPFRTAGISGPFFLLGPMTWEGLLGDLLSEHFSANGRFNDQTRVIQNRRTRSDDRLGAALYLPDKAAGICFRTDEKLTTGALWGSVILGPIVTLEGAIALSRRDEGMGREEWYPEKPPILQETRVGAGLRFRGKLKRIGWGGLILGCVGEHTLPAGRGELWLAWHQNGQSLMVHGGLASPGYMNLEGVTRQTEAETTLRYVGSFGPALNLRAGSDFRWKTTGIAQMTGTIGLRYAPGAFRFSTDGQYQWFPEPDLRKMKWTGSVGYDSGALSFLVIVQEEIPGGSSGILSLNPVLTASFRNFTLQAETLWNTDQPERFILEGRILYGSGPFHAGLDLSWKTDKPKEPPRMELTLKYAF